jgi:hypothetical protein
MFGKRSIITLMAAAITSAVLLPLAAGPAQASVEDGFYVGTTDFCGEGDYVDYGEGLPGGGMNDDYIEVTDRCTDHHGVKVWAWLTRDGVKHYLGGAYDPYGNIFAGNPSMIWDPFQSWGNVQANDYVGLKTCLVDGDNDPTPSKCNSETWQSHDGFMRSVGSARG